MARPKKEGQKREVRIVVYLTQDDAKRLKAESEKTGKAMSAFPEFVVIVTDSDLIPVETVSRLLKCETLIDFPGLKFRRSFVVLIEKELVSPVDSFNYILNRLGIKVSPMRKSL